MDIVKKVEAAVIRASKTQEMKDAFAKIGLETRIMNSEQFKKYWKEVEDTVGELVQVAKEMKK